MKQLDKECIYDLVLGWGQKNINRGFSSEDMTRDMSLLGLDSIEMVEFCEYLESEIGSNIDYEWLMSCETLMIVVNELTQKLSRADAQQNVLEPALAC